MDFGELSFFTGRGHPFVGRGCQNFLGWLKGGGPVFFSGGPEFFSLETKRERNFFTIIGKGGTRIFFAFEEGGPQKIDDRRSQTDAPPPVKNYFSLWVVG